MKKRNYSIDLLKLYFALLVAVEHTPFPSTLPKIPGGFLVVLFFILSGYFLVCSFDSGKYADPWQYTLGRVKRIWPYYAAAFVIMYLYMNLAGSTGLRSLVLEFFRSLPELFMLQSTGIFEGGINYPLWQLCTLVVASHIFFSLLCWNRQVTLNAVCPLTALLTYTYYIQVAEETALPFVYVPLARAAGALAMGMFLHRPIRLMVEKLEKCDLPGMPVLVSAAGVFCMLLVWTNRMEYDLVIPFTGVLVCLLYSGSFPWFRHPALGCLDKLTLGIYLNHALIVRIVEQRPGITAAVTFLPEDITFLVLVTAYTLVMMKAVDLVLAFGKKIWKREAAV